MNDPYGALWAVIFIALAGGMIGALYVGYVRLNRRKALEFAETIKSSELSVTAGDSRSQVEGDEVRVIERFVTIGGGGSGGNAGGFGRAHDGPVQQGNFGSAGGSKSVERLPPEYCPYCSRVFNWGTDNDSALVPERMENCRENAFWKLKFHIESDHAGEGHFCPRRGESPLGNSRGGKDWWNQEGEYRTCSYCGSLHEEDFFRAIEDGVKITPTDKNYKAYVDVRVKGAGKFYFQHLSEVGRARFIKLYNEKKMTLAVPGYFYVTPYFCGLGGTNAN